jgi:hypothetical protein
LFVCFCACLACVLRLDWRMRLPARLVSASMVFSAVCVAAAVFAARSLLVCSLRVCVPRQASSLPHVQGPEVSQEESCVSIYPRSCFSVWIAECMRCVALHSVLRSLRRVVATVAMFALQGPVTVSRSEVGLRLRLEARTSTACVSRARERARVRCVELELRLSCVLSVHERGWVRCESA